MTARISPVTAPYTLPITPRQGHGAPESHPSGFARRAMGLPKPSDSAASSSRHTLALPSTMDPHPPTTQPAPPLTARPPSGETGGYKRSVGLLKTLDFARLGSASGNNNTNGVAVGSSQSARVPVKTSSGALPSAPVPRMPTVPETARHHRPNTGNMKASSGVPPSLTSRSGLPIPKEAPRAGAMELPPAESVYTRAGGLSRPPPDGSMGKMLPAKALELYESILTRYERKEILDYDEIFFVGAGATKVDAPVSDGANFGYDDDKGDYVIVMGDHIAYRYEVVGGLGKGSFGQVLQVKDHKKGTVAALKLIRNKKRFHQQAMVEIKILDHLRCRDPDEKSCTVRMLNYFKFRSHTVITFDMHSINLYELTKLNGYQPFAPALIKRFTAQLLVSLAFMWQEQIVHCDIKPENVLLRYENKTSLKLIDFGSSCFENDRIYTYIQSRFYRAPEIILGIPYGRKIDMWSLGCVVCEMQMGFPIFPGESEVEQIQCIMEVLGVPPARTVEKAPRRGEFFEPNGAPKITPNSRNKVRKPGTKELAKVLRSDDASFVDFVKQFLQWDPAERFTPQEAMHHPWITECFRHVEPRPPAQPAGVAAPSGEPPKGDGQPSARRRSSASTSASIRTIGTIGKQLPAIERK